MLTFTTDTAPWWFVVALSGVLAILSTIVGALISSRSAREADRRHAVADAQANLLARQQKDGSDLREAAAILLVAARKYVAVYRGNFLLEAKPGMPIVFSPVPQPSLNDVSHVYEAYWRVVFLGNAVQQDAVRKLLRVVRRFEVRGSSEGQWKWLSDAQYKTASDTYVEARRSFVAAIQETAA